MRKFYPAPPPAPTPSVAGTPRPCVRCGYDLRGTPDVCPECGTLDVSAAVRSRTARRARARRVALRWAILGVACISLGLPIYSGRITSITAADLYESRRLGATPIERREIQWAEHAFGAVLAVAGGGFVLVAGRRFFSY